MRKTLEQCPACGGPLTISELRCQSCDTQIRGSFEPCPFCRLTDDQITFVRLMILNRGNLTELEKSLGVSYPTIRGKLDEIIVRLGGTPAPPGEKERPSRRRVLERIAAGELSAAEGAAQLQQLPDDAPNGGTAGQRA